MLNPLVRDYRRAVLLFAKVTKCSPEDAAALVKPIVMKSFERMLDASIQPRYDARRYQVPEVSNR